MADPNQLTGPRLAIAEIVQAIPQTPMHRVHLGVRLLGELRRDFRCVSESALGSGATRDGRLPFPAETPVTAGGTTG